jgi:hypothetical protein
VRELQKGGVSKAGEWRYLVVRIDIKVIEIRRDLGRFKTRPLPTLDEEKLQEFLTSKGAGVVSLNTLGAIHTIFVTRTNMEAGIVERDGPKVIWEVMAPGTKELGRLKV